MNAPELHTARLTLRGHEIADFEPYAAFMASSRAAHMGQLKRRHAWYSFTSDVAQWSLLGFGAWAITDKLTHAFLGQVALLKPDHFPEPELGWFVLKEAESRGIAYEAAQAALTFATSTLNLASLVSYIAPDNSRSIQLARRAGFVFEGVSPAYLYINGAWRDHERWAMLATEWEARTRAGTEA